MILLGRPCAFGVFVFYCIALYRARRPGSHARQRKAKKEISGRQIWLTQAGLDLTPNQYFAALAPSASSSSLSCLPPPPRRRCVGSAAVAVVFPPRFLLGRRRQGVGENSEGVARRNRGVDFQHRGQRVVARCVGADCPPGPEALRDAFDRFPSMASTSGVVPALEAVRERMADPNSDRVIEVLILAHERGGSIVTDILRDLATNTAEDLQLEEEIETSQLEQKINGRAVFVLPWAALILLMSTSADFKFFYQALLATSLSPSVRPPVCSASGLVSSRLRSRAAGIRVFGGSAIRSDS